MYGRDVWSSNEHNYMLRRFRTLTDAVPARSQRRDARYKCGQGCCVRHKQRTPAPCSAANRGHCRAVQRMQRSHALGGECGRSDPFRRVGVLPHPRIGSADGLDRLEALELRMSEIERLGRRDAAVRLAELLGAGPGLEIGLACARRCATRRGRDPPAPARAAGGTRRSPPSRRDGCRARARRPRSLRSHP